MRTITEPIKVMNLTPYKEVIEANLLFKRKKCSKCDLIKPLRFFGEQHGIEGYRPDCKQCRNEEERIRYKKNLIIKSTTW